MSENRRLRLAEFLTCLPESFPDPDVSHEDDGDYAVEWYFSTNRLFSVSVTVNGYACAWFTGHESYKRGEEPSLILKIQEWLEARNA